MQLQWSLHPTQINIRQARSAAYQYRLIEATNGRAVLTVQHRGDRPSEKPIKRFMYKNVNGAFGGAQRFEDQHGYRHDDTDRINRLCAAAWDEGYEAGYSAERNPLAPSEVLINPYRKTETTED